MSKLKDYPWWPTGWTSIGSSGAPSAAEVSVKATFTGCRYLSRGITIAGLYNGRAISARIDYSPSVNLDLKKLQVFLLAHKDKPMRDVENLEIDPKRLAP